MDQLKYTAKQGAYIEFIFGAYEAAQIVPLTHYYVEKEDATVDEGMSEEAGGSVITVAKMMTELNVEQCIISTDFGRYRLSTPVESLRQFTACMIDLDIEIEDVRKMVKTTPEKILGLEPLLEPPIVQNRGSVIF